MRPSHNIGAEYTMVYSIRDVTRGVTPALGAVVYFKVFISMKMLIIFLMVILTFSSCISLAPRHHRHHHLYHRRHIMNDRYWEKRFSAPSDVYKKRGF